MLPMQSIAEQIKDEIYQYMESLCILPEFSHQVIYKAYIRINWCGKHPYSPYPNQLFCASMDIDYNLENHITPEILISLSKGLIKDEIMTNKGIEIDARLIPNPILCCDGCNFNIAPYDTTGSIYCKVLAEELQTDGIQSGRCPLPKLSNEQADFYNKHSD